MAADKTGGYGPDGDAWEPELPPLGICAEAVPVMIRRSDKTGEFDFFNREWLAFTGGTAAEAVGMGWLRGLHPDDLQRYLVRFGDAFDARCELSADYRLRRHDGAYRRMLDRGRPFFDRNGGFAGYVLASVDIEDFHANGKATPGDRKPVNDEINHRVKNALFSVQALARQTMWGTDELERAYDRFTARLVALARTHDLMIEEDWRGASMRSLIRRVAQPFGREGTEFEMRGPDVQVAPQLSLSLALCLNELFTNAEKFGALSADGGKIAIDWAHSGKPEAPRMKIRWRETGADPARTSPAVSGLGTALIQVLGRDGGAEGEPGLTCLIEFPTSDGGAS